MGGLDRQEIIDTLADGKLGQALRIPGHLQGRNTRFSPAQDVTQMLVNAFSYSFHEEVGGNYAEFGVFQGRTFVEAYRVGKRFPTRPGGSSRLTRSRDSRRSPRSTPGERWAAGQFAAGLPAFEARLDAPGSPVHTVDRSGIL